MGASWRSPILRRGGDTRRNQLRDSDLRAPAPRRQRPGRQPAGTRFRNSRMSGSPSWTQLRTTRETPIGLPGIARADREFATA